MSQLLVGCAHLISVAALLLFQFKFQSLCKMFRKPDSMPFVQRITSRNSDRGSKTVGDREKGFRDKKSRATQITLR